MRACCTATRRSWSERLIHKFSTGDRFNRGDSRPSPPKLRFTTFRSIRLLVHGTFQSMKASQLPEVPGAPHFFVRGPYCWGRGPTIEAAIKAAQVRHNTIVHVCRTDDKAYCDEVVGNLMST